MTHALTFPAVDLLVAGRAVAVRPVRVKHLPAFLAAIEPLARELAAGDVYAALAHNAEALVAALALGAEVERAWLDEQDAETLVELAGAVLEVNADFFVQTLLPRATAVAERLAGRLTAAGGLTGLPASLPAASATPT